MFPRLSDLTICGCPKLVLQFLPSLKDLIVIGCNSELLRPISSFHCLTTLLLSEGNKMTSFPEGMLRNLTCLQTLILTNFPKLKELPNEPLSLALERLQFLVVVTLSLHRSKCWKVFNPFKQLKYLVVD